MTEKASWLSRPSFYGISVWCNVAGLAYGRTINQTELFETLAELSQPLATLCSWISVMQQAAIRLSITKQASQSSTLLHSDTEPECSSRQFDGHFWGFEILQGGSSSKENITNIISVKNSFGLFQFSVFYMAWNE